jgi:hypothetical protein
MRHAEMWNYHSIIMHYSMSLNLKHSRIFPCYVLFGALQVLSEMFCNNIKYNDI